LVSLRIQLKATQQTLPAQLVGRDYFSFPLENAHLNKLNYSAPTLTRLLIVMLLPSKAEDWTSASATALAIHHCAYWVNLEGVPATGNSKTTIRVPTGNRFDVESLCEMMQGIGEGVRPR